MDDQIWLKHYDPGVPQHLEYPAVPLFHFLEETARKYPNTACTIFKGARISYRRMNRLTDRLAAGLAALGVRKGDRVGIFMPNTPQFVMAYFAILKAGGVVVATNPLYSPREIEHQVNDAGIEVMLVMSNFYKIIKEVQPNTRLRTVIVTNIKEALPFPLSTLFALTRRRKGGSPRPAPARRCVDEGFDPEPHLRRAAAGRDRPGRHRLVPVQRRHHRHLQGRGGAAPQPGGQHAADPRLVRHLPRTAKRSC